MSWCISYPGAETAMYVKNNAVIERETESTIKMALTDNITKEYTDELVENKALANITCAIMGLTVDRIHEPDNINEMNGEVSKSCMSPRNGICDNSRENIKKYFIR